MNLYPHLTQKNRNQRYSEKDFEILRIFFYIFEREAIMDKKFESLLQGC